jgi:hypothetical protein
LPPSLPPFLPLLTYPPNTPTAPTGATKDAIVNSDKGPGSWSDSVGNAFLAPYELNADKSTFTAIGTKGPIHQQLNDFDVKVYPYQGAVDGNTTGNVSR